MSETLINKQDFHKNINGTVRIAILTFNRSNYLSEILECVKIQTWADFTVTVFDNGSTDSTEQTCQSVCNSDSRFFYERWPNNRGGQANFARARKWAEDADFYALLHDDDLVEAEWLENALRIMHSSEELSFVATNAKIIKGENSNPLGIIYPKTQGSLIFNDHKVFLNWFFNNGNIVFPSIVYRSRYTIKTPALSHVRTCDIIWYLSVAEKSNVAIVYVPTFIYRLHSDQDTNKISDYDYMALHDFVLTHVKFNAPELIGKAKAWLLTHRLAMLKRIFNDLGFISRIKIIQKEIASGKLKFFCSDTKYYARILKLIIS